MGLPGIYSGWLSTGEAARHSKRPGEAELMTDVWMSDRKLIGERPPDEYRREAVLVEEMMLPALVRNYVGSCSDHDGRISSALTGRTAREKANQDGRLAPGRNPDDRNSGT